MLYAQFFQPSVMDSTELIESCGDRGVIILDARFSPSHNEEVARIEGKKRGYDAYQLCAGESFSRSKPTSKIVKIKE